MKIEDLEYVFVAIDEMDPEKVKVSFAKFVGAVSQQEDAAGIERVISLLFGNRPDNSMKLSEETKSRMGIIEFRT
jgi:hypothetical protein